MEPLKEGLFDIFNTFNDVRTPIDDDSIPLTLKDDNTKLLILVPPALHLIPCHLVHGSNKFVTVKFHATLLFVNNQCCPLPS